MSDIVEDTPSTGQKFTAEALGTFVLVFFGCGAALMSGGDYLTTGLTFGNVGSPVINEFISEIEIITGAKLQSTKVGKEGVTLTLEAAGKKHEIKVDKVLVATGRAPVGDRPGVREQAAGLHEVLGPSRREGPDDRAGESRRRGRSRAGPRADRAAHGVTSHHRDHLRRSP